MESEATSIRRLFFLDLILEDHSLGLGAILQVANRSFLPPSRVQLTASQGLNDE